MTRTATNAGANRPVTRYITDDEQRAAIAADNDLALVLLTIGDATATAFANGEQLSMQQINERFGANLPDAPTHYKKGKKAGRPRPERLVKAENANKAAALFRRVKVRYGQSNLIGAINDLDSALGGSGNRTPTVDFDGVVAAQKLVKPVAQG